MRNLNELNEFRRVDWELRAVGAMGDKSAGCFVVPCDGVELAVMASTGKGWDHLSISVKDRCPTWGEMEHVRKLFSKSHEIYFQVGVPAKDHINNHPYCLHWWRRQNREIQLPPSIMV